MKLYCSKCLCELTSTAYDIGTYVDECENCKPDIEDIEETNYEAGYEKGEDDTYDSVSTKLELILDIEDPELRDKVLVEYYKEL